MEKLRDCAQQRQAKKVRAPIGKKSLDCIRRVAAQFRERRKLKTNRPSASCRHVGRDRRNSLDDQPVRP